MTRYAPRSDFVFGSLPLHDLRYARCSTFVFGSLHLHAPRYACRSWDAGFILLDVLMNVDSFKQQTCLELGAGCGFVTLGLKYLSFNNLTTSDYDDGVIELLAKNVGEDVTVRKIDWFKSETYENEKKYDLIIGSAVVYSPEHKVLAKVRMRSEATIFATYTSTSTLASLAASLAKGHRRST